MLLCDILHFGSIILQNFFLLTQLSNIPTSLGSYREVPLRCLTLAWKSLTFTRLAKQVVTCDECWNISVLYCLQRTAHCRHIAQFVLFSFAVSINIKPSTVSTDHYVCCYINWTDILHNKMVLLLKGVSRSLMKIEFASIKEQSFVPDSLSECNSNGCYRVAKKQRTLFQKKTGV